MKSEHVDGEDCRFDEAEKPCVGNNHELTSQNRRALLLGAQPSFTKL